MNVPREDGRLEEADRHAAALEWAYHRMMEEKAQQADAAERRKERRLWTRTTLTAVLAAVATSLLGLLTGIIRSLWDVWYTR